MARQGLGLGLGKGFHGSLNYGSWLRLWLLVMAMVVGFVAMVVPGLGARDLLDFRISVTRTSNSTGLGLKLLG
jgi:hypothetical protein